MKDTIEHKLQTSLIELLKESFFNDITVVELCSYSKVNRQSFYYHYKDLYDLVDSIFINEYHILLNFKKWDIFCENLLNYILNNYSLLKEIAISSSADILHDFFFDLLYYFSLLELKALYKDLDDGIIHFIARVYSNSFSGELCFCLAHKKENELKTFDHKFDIIKDNNYINSLVNSN